MEVTTNGTKNYYARVASPDLGRWVNGELELGFLSVIDGESLHEQRGETGTRATAEGVEDEEALKAGARVGLRGKWIIRYISVSIHR